MSDSATLTIEMSIIAMSAAHITAMVMPTFDPLICPWPCILNPHAVERSTGKRGSGEREETGAAATMPKCLVHRCERQRCREREPRRQRGAGAAAHLKFPASPLPC